MNSISLRNNNNPKFEKYNHSKTQKLILLDPDKNINSRSTSLSLDKTKIINSKKSNFNSLNFSNNERLNDNQSERFDAFGNEIIRGSKNHKVSFIDNISRKKIAEVILVENDYNLHHYPIDRIDENENEKNGYQCDNCCMVY
jgi:hypothetical protein